MSQIIYTKEFISDFERLYTFLNEKNSIAAQNLTKLLGKKLELLASIPKAFPFFGEYRLYLLEFGSSGYAILYDFDETADLIILLRINIKSKRDFNFYFVLH